jgi:ribokinase
MIKENISTGVAPITVSAEDGENNIIVIPGANLKLTPGDLINKIDLFKKSKMVVCQNEISQETTKKVQKVVKHLQKILKKHAWIGDFFR